MLASKLVPLTPVPEYVPPAGLTLPKLVKSKVVAYGGAVLDGSQLAAI